MISILPLVIGPEHASTQNHPWHDAFFDPNQTGYLDSPIRFASIKKNTMEIVFENKYRAWNLDGVEDHPHIVNFAANIMLGKTGQDIFDMEDVHSYLTNSMTHEDTAWGIINSQKMTQKEFCLNINSFAYWLSPYSNLLDCPLARHVANDMFEGLFRTKHPQKLSQYIKDVIAQRDENGQKIDNHEKKAIVIPAFCPNLDEHSSAHDVFFFMKKLQDDMMMIEEERMTKLRMFNTKIIESEVLTPIFIPKIR